MHNQHPQTAYRKYAILIGTIIENCDNKIALPHQIHLSLFSDLRFGAPRWILFVRGLSARVNASKIVSLKSADIPIPLSLTKKRQP
jgi:hypothetical protein